MFMERDFYVFLLSEYGHDVTDDARVFACLYIW